MRGGERDPFRCRALLARALCVLDPLIELPCSVHTSPSTWLARA